MVLQFIRFSIRQKAHTHRHTKGEMAGTFGKWKQPPPIVQSWHSSNGSNFETKPLKADYSTVHFPLGETGPI